LASCVAKQAIRRASQATSQPTQSRGKPNIVLPGAREKNSFITPATTVSATGSNRGVYIASYVIENGGSYPDCKTDHQPPTSIKVKHTCGRTSTPFYGTAARYAESSGHECL